MPASRFYDSSQSYNNYNTSNNHNNHSPLYNEYQNKPSSTIHRRVPSSLYDDPTLFEEQQHVSEGQSQYSVPLEPRPSNNNNNINGRPDHIVI